MLSLQRVTNRLATSPVISKNNALFPIGTPAHTMPCFHLDLRIVSATLQRSKRGGACVTRQAISPPRCMSYVRTTNEFATGYVRYAISPRAEQECSGWRFRTKHGNGVANTLVDGIPR